MKKQKKWLVTALLVGIVLISVIGIAGKAGVLQGKYPLTVAPSSGLFRWRGQAVSLVTTPVTSVVTTPVTSSGGTSQVPTTVTTPVASPVVIPLQQSQNVNVGNLPKLTKAILTQAAKDDFAKTPSKYKLTPAERQRLINLFLNSKKK